MSVPSIEKLTALEPWTVVGVRAGDLLDCLANAAEAATAARAELSTARDVLADYREFGTVAELGAASAAVQALSDQFLARRDAIDSNDGRGTPGRRARMAWEDAARLVRAALSAAPQPEPVHNHGPAEGAGLDCPEGTTTDGALRGACLAPGKPWSETDEDADPGCCRFPDACSCPAASSTPAGGR